MAEGGLTVKVVLEHKYDTEDDEEVWKAEVKDWGLEAKPPELDGVIKIMERKIATYLQNTFGTRRRITASVIKSTARVEFGIEVEKDRKLADFEKTPGARE